MHTIRLSGCRIVAIMSGFQPEEVGSIPITRSKMKSRPRGSGFCFVVNGKEPEVRCGVGTRDAGKLV